LENEINQVTEENDIGILIDDKLKFQQHINQQTKQSKPKTWNDKKKFQLHEDFESLNHVGFQSSVLK
jgi:hypothetical protein